MTPSSSESMVEITTALVWVPPTKNSTSTSSLPQAFLIFSLALSEYISNPYLITNDEGTGVEDKYEALKYDLSRLDADIKETISLSSYDTIVVDNDVFNFLSKYNLNVISLEEDDKLTDIKINEVKKLINEGKIKYIYSSKTETNNTCKKLIEDYGVELVTFNTMETVDGGITNSNENYVTVMNNNLELLNKELYK